MLNAPRLYTRRCRRPFPCRWSTVRTVSRTSQGLTATTAMAPTRTSTASSIRQSPPRRGASGLSSGRSPASWRPRCSRSSSWPSRAASRSSRTRSTTSPTRPPPFRSGSRSPVRHHARDPGNRLAVSRGRLRPDARRHRSGGAGRGGACRPPRVPPDGAPRRERRRPHLRAIEAGGLAHGLRCGAARFSARLRPLLPPRRQDRHGRPPRALVSPRPGGVPPVAPRSPSSRSETVSR